MKLFVKKMVPVELPLIFAWHGRLQFIGMDERWMLKFGEGLDGNV